MTPVLTALAPGSAPGGADGGCVRRCPGTHTGRAPTEMPLNASDGEADVLPTCDCHQVEYRSMVESERAEAWTPSGL